MTNKQLLEWAVETEDLLYWTGSPTRTHNGQRIAKVIGMRLSIAMIPQETSGN